MAKQVHDKLDEVNESILQLRNIDDIQFKALCDRVSNILTQVTLQRQFDEVLGLIQQNKSLPVRRISFTLKKLFDGSEQSKSQWEKLRSLDFNNLILCVLSFPGLLSLQPDHFNWLVDNTDRYLKAQGFSTNLIEIDQVQGVIKNIPRRENTKEFLKAYYKLEIQLCHEHGPNLEEPSRKRSRIEDETPLPSIPPMPLTLPLTVQAAEVILAHTRDGWNEGLNISFPAMYPAVITVPLHICTQIIATYRT